MSAEERRFERLFPGFFSPEPPDDRKNYDDMRRYPGHPDMSSVDISNFKLIGNFVTEIDGNGEVTDYRFESAIGD